MHPPPGYECALHLEADGTYLWSISGPKHLFEKVYGGIHYVIVQFVESDDPFVLPIGKNATPIPSFRPAIHRTFANGNAIQSLYDVLRYGQPPSKTCVYGMLNLALELNIIDVPSDASRRLTSLYEQQFGSFCARYYNENPDHVLPRRLEESNIRAAEFYRIAGAYGMTVEYRQGYTKILGRGGRVYTLDMNLQPVEIRELPGGVIIPCEIDPGPVLAAHKDLSPSVQTFYVQDMAARITGEW